ncbi:MAG: alpha/beta hydrolase, partial [Acidimicrobiia bacterium]|nr:alpha/beta hydrolase [Acidimicrobiia bacterium]
MDGPTTRVGLPDGRTLAADDVGAADGRPVVYVHGTPDSRLARHPDDGIARRLGVRLLAVDRPGFGHSSPDPAGTAASFGRDVGVLARELGLADIAVLGWSAGAVSALGVAAACGPLVRTVGIAAGLPPGPAYGDPAVLDAAADGQRLLVEMAAEQGVEATAAELSPYLVPDPPSLELAREHLRTGSDEVRLAELDSVPGGLDAMAAAMVDAVRGGLEGIRRDLELQVLPPDIDLDRIEVPVHLWYAELDQTAPPAYGRWYE